MKLREFNLGRRRCDPSHRGAKRDGHGRHARRRALRPRAAIDGVGQGQGAIDLAGRIRRDRAEGAPDGSAVRLKDVARVELGRDSYASFSRLNGKPAATVGIRLSPQGNAMETSNAIRARLAELSRSLPPGVAVEIPFDSSKFVQVAIHEVALTLFEAVVLVFLVMWLFLRDLRYALVPTVVIPVALMGALLALYVLGMSINVFTMFGLVLAIGILVDDAIVVVESVDRVMREEGLAPREATRRAMSQIGGAIVGMTAVLTAVFVPMAFFPGSVGGIYRQFAVAMIASMLRVLVHGAFADAGAVRESAEGAAAQCVRRGAHGRRHRTVHTRPVAGRSASRRPSTAPRGGYRGLVARALRRAGPMLAVYLVLAGACGVLYCRCRAASCRRKTRRSFR